MSHPIPRPRPEALLAALVALSLSLTSAPSTHGQATSFVRGDANADATVDISDAVATLTFLFQGDARLRCLDAADSNDDGDVDISDALATVRYLFLDGPRPPSDDEGSCAPDRTPDGIYCLEYPACPQPDRPFEVRRGNAVIEGDIVLGTVEEVLGELSGDNGGGASLHRGRDWPTPERIPYTIDAVMNANSMMRVRIEDALAQWTAATNGAVDFVRRTSERDYLAFQGYSDMDGACGRSKVGRAGGRQEIELLNSPSSGDFASRGCVAHEVGHALGLKHEQSRPDRDQYVDILTQNLKEECLLFICWRPDGSNFDRVDGATCGPYDYSSIMHYAREAFSDNGQPTIDAFGEPIGQGTQPSDGDALGIAGRYGSVTNACDCADALGAGSPRAIGRGGVERVGSHVDLVALNFERDGEMTFPLSGEFDLPVRLTIENRGDAVAVRSTLELRGDAEGRVTFTAAGSTTTGAPWVCVAPGDTTIVRGTMRIPADALGTTRSYRLEVDSTGSIAESDEQNNLSADLTIRFPDECQVVTGPGGERLRTCDEVTSPGELPDLVVSSLRVTGAAVVVDDSVIDVPIQAVVENRGAGTAPIFKVAAHYDGGTAVPFTVPGQSNSRYPQTGAELSPGESVSFAGKVRFPGSAAGSWVSLRVLADSCDGDEILESDRCLAYESDETNNLSDDAQVYLPDLPRNVTVSLADLPTYTPPHTRGDSDFGGHGPRVTLKASLRVTSDGRALQAQVEMRATEWEDGAPRSDYTTAEGTSRWSTVYTAPSGRTITRILSGTSSRGEYVDTDHASDDITPYRGDLVREFVCVGDTRGSDAGVDTRVTVRFEPATVRLE